MEEWIPAAGFSYRWDKRLGGWRTLSDDSPDVALRHPTFRTYAGHMHSPAFMAAITDLRHTIPVAQTPGRTAVMCSVHMRSPCHRRMIADSITLINAPT